MELKDLVGRHLLSGLDSVQEEVENGYGGYNDTVNVIRFVLDGITYKAIEDPDDGWRSYLGELNVSTEPVRFQFPPQEVECRMRPDTDGDWPESGNVLQMFDVFTNKIVLEIGTDTSDDYYPCCILHWYPQNLAINQNVSN